MSWGNWGACCSWDLGGGEPSEEARARSSLVSLSFEDRDDLSAPEKGAVTNNFKLHASRFTNSSFHAIHSGSPLGFCGIKKSMPF